MGPARERLRQATAEAHRRLDADIACRDLSNRDIYRRFLLGHAGVLTPLEVALETAGVERLLPDWPQRRRRDALAADLAELGVRPPEARTGPSIDGEAALMGALYVLEGSRLGGVVLARQAAGGPPEVRNALRYLTHGHGSGLWPAYLVRLEESAAVRAEPLVAEASALAVFAAFREALGQPFA